MSLGRSESLKDDNLLFSERFDLTISNAGNASSLNLFRSVLFGITNGIAFTIFELIAVAIDDVLPNDC